MLSVVSRRDDTIILASEITTAHDAKHKCLFTAAAELEEALFGKPDIITAALADSHMHSFLKLGDTFIHR